MVRLAALLALGTLALGLAAPAPAAPPAKVTVAIAVNGQNLYSRGELGTGYLLTEARATGSFTLGAGKDTGFYKEFPVESLKLGLSLVSHYEGEAGKEPPPDRVLALTATRVVWYRVGTSGTYLKLEARVERSDFPGCAGRAVLNIKDERAGDRVEVACGKLGVTFLAPAASVSFATAGAATAAKTPKPDANAPTVYTSSRGLMMYSSTRTRRPSTPGASASNARRSRPASTSRRSKARARTRSPAEAG